MQKQKPDNNSVFQSASIFAQLLDAYARTINNYENIANTSTALPWLLVIAPMIGDLRAEFEKFEYEFIAAAIEADIDIQTLARDLGYTPTTMYRRVNKIKGEEEKPALRKTRLVNADKPNPTPQEIEALIPIPKTGDLPQSTRKMVPRPPLQAPTTDVPNHMKSQPMQPHTEQQYNEWRQQIREEQ